MNWQQILTAVISLIAAWFASRAKSSVKTESAKTRKHVTTEMYQHRQISLSSAVSPTQSDQPNVTQITGVESAHE